MSRIFLAGPLLFILLALSCGGEEVSLDRPNIIIVIIDTLRADHLGCYGYSRNTSPQLDSLAAAGTRWSNFQAQAPWTLPATATIFTGLNVRQHGSGRRGDGDHVLHAEVPTIPSIFEAAGYATCGIFNVCVLSEQMGFARGFDYYSCAEYGVDRAAETVDEFILWLEGLEGERPFLAVLHVFDVHQPYDPPPPYDGMFIEDDTLESVYWEITDEGEIAHPEHLEYFLARYDGSIRLVDDQLGRLFEHLRSTGLSDSAVVVVTADHGEEFLERGWIGHGGHLYQEMLHVPLIISGPGIEAGRTIDTPAGQMDILPTMLSLASIDTDTFLQGMDILDPETPERRPLPAGSLMFRGAMAGGTPLAAVRYGDVKGVVTRRGSTDSYYIYDLATDPHERDPMEADRVMMEILDHYRSTPRIWNPERVAELDSASTRALQDLGYI